jgi:hypothetical protein
MFETWLHTVFSEMERARAICLLPLPRDFMICISRSVSWGLRVLRRRGGACVALSTGLYLCTNVVDDDGLAEIGPFGSTVLEGNLVVEGTGLPAGFTPNFFATGWTGDQALEVANRTTREERVFEPQG